MNYTGEPSYQYKPFQYPPDFQIARLHQKASVFGKQNSHQPACPCCKKRPRTPYKTWWSRSIENDYKNFGGAIVSYFWLLKLYSISTTLVFVIYGIYLQYLNQHYCSQLADEAKKSQVCSNLFGFWLIASNDLHDLMTMAQDYEERARFSLLRSMTFAILLATNLGSLYVMKWFKVRYPDKKTTADFSLVFKNLKTNNIEDLLVKLRQQFGDFQVKQAFIFKRLQPYYSKAQQKLNLYYQCRIQKNQKKKLKLLNKLKQIGDFCSEHQAQFHQDSKSGLLVFQENLIRDKIFNKYHVSKLTKIRMFLNDNFQQQHALFCDQCARSDEFIWNNMGKCDKKDFRQKVKSIVYFIALLGLIYLLLHFSFQIMYSEDIHEPLTSIITFITLIIMSIMALVFRFLMDYLSDLRYPNTYTQRTMYIIVTTVLFHFIYYLFIPTIYLKNQEDRRGNVLKLIANQTLSFILLHIVFCSLDIIHYLWNFNKKKVQDQQNPIGCQKILHTRIQLPRFPLEMKLIVMFKLWALCMFFAFQTPLVLFCLLAVMILHFIKDKYNLYHHYRMQVIQNKVQFNFLRIYVNVFAIFMYFIFVATQKSTLQLVVSSIMTGLTIILQLFYFTQYKKKNKDEEGQDSKRYLLQELDQGQIESFKQKYDKFIEISHNEEVDNQIKEYVQNKYKSEPEKESINTA